MVSRLSKSIIDFNENRDEFIEDLNYFLKILGSKDVDFL